MEGGSWLITNDKSEDAIFLYPDLLTALVGRIKIDSSSSSPSHQLLCCKVSNLAFDSGILRPSLQELASAPLLVGKGKFSFFAINETKIYITQVSLIQLSNFLVSVIHMKLILLKSNNH